MKQQIGVFMKIKPEIFFKLRALSQNIKDFQIQTQNQNEGRKDRGTEFGLDFDDNGDLEGEFFRGTGGNLQRKKNQYDMEMKVDDQDLGEEMVGEVMDVILEENETDIVGGNTNKTRTESQKNKKIERPKDIQKGIQSVMLKDSMQMGRKREDSDEEEKSEEEQEQVFNRGRAYLNDRLQLQTLSLEKMGEFVEILGLEDDGECQNEMFSFLGDQEGLPSPDPRTVKEVYDNRHEIHFNISLEMRKNSPQKMEELIVKMKKSELGTKMLEQKAKFVVKNQDNSGESQIGQLILRSKEMKELLEKSNFLENKLNKKEELDNETLAGLGKTTLRMKFKVKQSSANVGKNIRMPRNTTKMSEKGYEVVKIPAETKTGDFGIKIKAVKDVIPKYMHKIFGEIEKFNKIQVTFFLK